MRASELQKELRIGNYLLGKCVDESDERKEWWQQYQIKDAEDLMGVKDDWDKRIHLTEEWLLKFGFEKKADYQFFNMQLVLEFWKILNKKIDVRFRINENESIIICEIQYVHQLQNLYFALCGEELELK